MPDGARFSGDSARETTIEHAGASVQGPTSRVPLPVGAVLAGRYEVRRPLGRGGMGIVLRARDRLLGEEVAVKILRPELVHERQWAERLAREVKLARQLHHPNVCRVFDFVQSDGQAFIVMELAERTLRDELDASERGEATLGLAEQRLADARAVAQGLAAVHAAGIVHRDVTPSNVLRLRDGRLALSDFGLAIDDSQTSASVRGGTIAYMAPELAGGGRASMASDIWALGVVIHEIVFGRRPVWRGGIVGTRIESPLPSIVDWEREVLRICRHCTMASVAGRPSRADDVVGRLDSVESLRRRTRLRQRVGMSLGALMLLTAVLAVFVGARVGGRTNKRIGISPAPSNDPAIEVTGTPEDWTTSSRVLAEVPAKVHCLTPVPGTRTIRFAWGYPKRVDDLNVDTGERRPARLVPEATIEGCPDLSPDGRELVFQGHDSNGQARIFRSPHADGSAAVPVVAAADPSYLSEPRWFAGGAAFVFDADTRHVGVVDRGTGRPTILAEAPVEDHSTLFRFVCGNSINVVRTNSDLDGIVETYLWPSLEPIRHAKIKNLSAAWHSEDCNTFYTFERSGDSVVELDSARRRARRIGRVKGKWPSLFSSLGPDLVFTAVSRTSDLWVRDRGGRLQRVTSTRDVFQVAACGRRELLLGAREYTTGEGEIRLIKPDGTSVTLVRGRVENPACAHTSEDWWYTDYSRLPVVTYRCDRLQNCKKIGEDFYFGLVLSPDDSRIAFLVNSNGGVRVRWMPSDGGVPHDIGESETACLPGWSSNGTLWISRRLHGALMWTEIDVDTGKPTGRTAPGGKSCADGLPDPASPADGDVRVVYDYKTEIRLKRLP